MGNNYNIHTPFDDSYYYCPDNSCPCQRQDNPFYGCSQDSCSCHYDDTDSDTCDCPCHNTTATEGDYQHFDNIFSSHDYD